MHHHRRVRPRPGFTIVELLVVVGVTTVLMGLVLAGLSSARRQAATTTERSHLRQIGIAWVSYANQSNDAALPAYLSVRTQRSWRTRYRQPDGTLLTPAPEYVTADERPEDNLAGPWPWRLLPFLDHDVETVTLRRDDGSHDDDPAAAAAAVSHRPKFAYNGLHVGGWWNGTTTWLGGTYRDLETERAVHLESRTLGSVRRPDRLITFVPGARITSGVHRFHRSSADPEGTHVVLPPILGTRVIWGPAQGIGDPQAISVLPIQDGALPGL